MKKWKLLSAKSLLDTPWMKVEDRSYDVGDGVVREHYYHIQKQDFAVIIPVMPDGRLVVVRQYRRGTDEFLYEWPAGMVDPGEDVVQTAVRELAEETGYIGEGRLLATLHVQPAFASMRAHVVLVKIQQAGQPDLDPDETLEVHLFEVEEVRRMIRLGWIVDMTFLAAFQCFEHQSL